jgi:hypothetical protein
MREDLLIQRLREGLRKWAAKSPQERFDEMVRRGVIDEQGNVLKRAPEPPKKKKKQRRS